MLDASFILRFFVFRRDRHTLLFHLMLLSSLIFLFFDIFHFISR